MNDVTQTTSQSTEEEVEDEPAVDAHLDDVEVGAGCTEIWEHLSEQREDDD